MITKGFPKMKDRKRIPQAYKSKHITGGIYGQCDYHGRDYAAPFYTEQ